MPPGRPLLVLDVDGVLLPYLPDSHDGPPPAGFAPARAWGFDVWVPKHLPPALARLAARFECVWCTDWHEAANTEVAPLFGLPQLPVLGDRHGDRGWWKLAAVRAYAEQRPLAWADDRMSSSARRWASTRSAPTLLQRPARHVGLSSRQVAALERFSAALL